MKQHKFSSKEKLEIVLSGIQKGSRLAEICNRHGISQTTYYKWRDKLFSSSDRVFSAGAFSRSEERLKAENRNLREIIGDLTVELKKKLL